MQKRGGGGITTFRSKFLVSQYRKFRWGTLRCIRKLRVLKNFYASERGEYHVSPSKTFCHTIQKNFVGEHFGVSRNFGYRKILCIREGGGGYHVLRQKLFVTQYRKNSWGTLRCFRKFRVSQNFMNKKRISLNSVENFLSHSAEKFRKGILLFLRNFLVSKSFMDEKGGITFFCRKFLVSQCRKISWASLQCFRKFGV